MILFTAATSVTILLPFTKALPLSGFVKQVSIFNCGRFSLPHLRQAEQIIRLAGRQIKAVYGGYILIFFCKLNSFKLPALSFPSV